MTLTLMTTPPDQPDRHDLELLTLAEVAELWRVSKRTVQRLVAAGELPSVTIGGHRRIRLEDARQLAREGSSMVSRPQPKGSSR